MKHVDDIQDIRIQILKYLRDRDSALEQHSTNEYLSTLKTSTGEKDLGSIRRALVDLEKRDFIQQTNPDSKHILVSLLTTRETPYDDISDPGRFLDSWSGEAPKIDPVYLGITLGGMKFLLDLDHEANIHRETVRGNNLLLILIVVTILTVISSIVDNYLQNKQYKCCEEGKEMTEHTESPMQETEDSVVYVHDTIFVDSSSVSLSDTSVSIITP